VGKFNPCRAIPADRCWRQPIFDDSNCKAFSALTFCSVILAIGRHARDIQACGFPLHHSSAVIVVVASPQVGGTVQQGQQGGIGAGHIDPATWNMQRDLFGERAEIQGFNAFGQQRQRVDHLYAGQGASQRAEAAGGY
jgi:streptogramin lyase